MRVFLALAACLLPLALVRVKLSPNPFASGNPFRQELRLQQGDMLISRAPASEVTMRLWVDANQPVIRVQTCSDQPVSQQVLLETWRNEQSILTNTQVSDLFENLYGPDPYPTILFPDTIVQGPNSEPPTTSSTARSRKSAHNRAESPRVPRSFSPAGITLFSTLAKTHCACTSTVARKCGSMRSGFSRGR